VDYQRHIHDDGTFSIEIDGFFKITVKEKGKPLYTHESKNGNRIYSVSILPNKGVLVGASRFMTLLDLRSGKVLRNYEGDTGLTISLAPSPDGRHFISGSTDQTIRVWNPDRDEPVLSIFVAGRDWIAWTPQGYYSCSAYGERLIAWQVNNGNAKLPSIHPAVRFPTIPLPTGTDQVPDPGRRSETGSRHG
jgi:WD40 repeat protein